MTIVQANDRLIAARRMRTSLTNDIEILRNTRNQIKIIKQRIETRTSTFHQASKRENTDWRGESGTKYNGYRAQTQTNTRLYIQEIDGTVDRVTQRIVTLETQRTTINRTIRELEEFIRNEKVM